MPKLDPATLRDEPADHTARTGDRTATEQFISAIKGMLVGDEYEYADTTLRGILQTVERSGIATPAQRQAVANIADKPQRHTQDRGGRYGRYR